jgi:hypothetical protein
MHNYKHGGTAKGSKARYKGDDERNDTIDAKLSENEIVIPRSITMGKHPLEDSAEFVHNQLMKHQSKEHMSKGGEVGKDKIGTVMSEFKAGDLHSGSKNGPEVKNKRQAVAIALAEAKKHGEHVAPKKMSGGGLTDTDEHYGEIDELEREMLDSNSGKYIGKKLLKNMDDAGYHLSLGGMVESSRKRLAQKMAEGGFPTLTNQRSRQEAADALNQAIHRGQEVPAQEEQGEQKPKKK